MKTDRQLMEMEKDTPKYAVYVWTGQYLYLGCMYDNTEHRHHALQLILDREGLFQLKVDGSSIECGGAIIRSDCRHQVLTSNDTQIHLLIDHGSEVATALTRQHLGEGNVKILEGALLDRLRKYVGVPGNYLGSCGQAQEVIGKIVSELGGYAGLSEEKVDPRLLAVMNLLREKYLSEKVPIDKLARHACLSESRLMHLFCKEIGLPLRRYVLWLRLLSAIGFVFQGQSITDAAHSAGFSDSSHLSRTWRKMFGFTFSHCVKNSRFVQVISCFS